jgi:hypothetical protein
VVLNTGEVGIIDFKSSREAYFTQFVQCAGYDIEISENGWLTKDGEEIGKLPSPIQFYGVFPFGEENPKLWVRKNVEELKEAFRAAVVLYKHQQNHDE